MRQTVFAHQDLIQAVEHDGVFLDDESSEVEVSAGSWGITRVGAAATGRSGAGVNIYVLDSGVRVSHTEFGGRAISTLEASRRRAAFTVCNGDPNCGQDNRGHGTHVAATAGGATYGVASAATIRG